MVNSPIEQLIKELTAAMERNDETAAKSLAIALASILAMDLHRASVSLERIADILESSHAR